MDLKTLTATVQHNCHISDALYAGHYTVCVFLLKMREYYRWEQGLPLTAPLKREEIGEWLVAREAKWDEIEDESWLPLELGSSDIAPYEADKINHILVPAGHVYSSGTGLFNKPHFFIGELISTEQNADVTIHVAGREYARDLVAPPSMHRAGTVFIRTESLRRYLWERIEDWRFHKSDPQRPMGRAIAHYDASLLNHTNEEATEQMLECMCANETEILIQHELGEAQAGKLLGKGWGEMIAAHPRTKLEFYARGARDLLADSLTTLPEMIERQNTASLHIYFANFQGIRKMLFPALHAAYLNWCEGAGLGPIRELAMRSSEHWATTLNYALAHYETHPDDIDSVVAQIEAAAL